MKKSIISIITLLFCYSCAEEKVTQPKQNIASNKWDTISVEISKFVHCKDFWVKEPLIIHDDSTYHYHEQYNKQKKSPYCDNFSYPKVDFSTHDVIWWNYIYSSFQERPIGILRKNDSLKKYEYISVLSTKYKDLPMHSSAHFQIVPKLSKDYSVTFVKDTIGEPW
ncbi:MAG: hypothetical protein IPK11_05590 [Ignavibacteria bacterium]|nr:hypothetical protein [Ignavibacteria bacterium]